MILGAKRPRKSPTGSPNKPSRNTLRPRNRRSHDHRVRSHLQRPANLLRLGNMSLDNDRNRQARNQSFNQRPGNLPVPCSFAGVPEESARNRISPGTLRSNRVVNRSDVRTNRPPQLAMNPPNQLRPGLRLQQPSPRAIESDDIRTRLAYSTSRREIRRNVDLSVRILRFDKSNHRQLSKPTKRPDARDTLRPQPPGPTSQSRSSHSRQRIDIVHGISRRRLTRHNHPRAQRSKDLSPRTLRTLNHGRSPRRQNAAPHQLAYPQNDLTSSIKHHV
jgi:hypothetical protein